MEYRGPLPDIEIPDVSLYDLLFGEQAQADPDQTAFVHPESGASRTYGEVKQHTDAVATWLAARGIGPGSAVAIDLQNCPDYAAAFHGIARTGAATSPVNPAAIAPEIARQLTETNARFVITSQALLGKVAEAATLAGLPAEAVIVLEGAEGHTAWSDVLATPVDLPEVSIDPATHLVCLPFSSGTSGLPKAVMLTHRNLVANLLQFNEVLAGMGDDNSIVAFLPYSHIYGMTTNLNYGLFRGFPQYTMASFAPQAFLEIIATRRPSLLFIVPPVAAFLAKHPAALSVGWDSVKLIVSGAAPLDGAVGELIQQRLGTRVVQGYGMTELSPVTHVIPPERPDIDLGTIGPAIPNVRFRVVDPETGLDVAPPTSGESQPGELWCTGPNAMVGYLGSPVDADAVLDADGWVHTGDLVTVDAEGVVRIVDRIKELIKRRGFQVAPAELEALLCAHPAVADAGVLGLASSTPGEQIPHALVQLREGAEVSPGELTRWVADQVAAYKRLGGVTFVEKVPRSAAGKVLRRELPKVYAASKTS
ncbi:MAG: AMP-binding protein [Propionibacteriales bacterium]|nr:AMP-binding protein [Propionibacteriales bacterium]